MKILNGKKYFDKQDVKDITALAKLVVNNPYDNLDFLFKADTDEVDGVVRGIDSLANTINWEFVTESAVSMAKIDEFARSLRPLVTEMVTFEEYNKLPVEKLSKNVMERYENWLKSVGVDILSDEFKKN